MPASPFVFQWVNACARDRRAGARALDVAMGRGRHAVLLARAGYVTFGVDWKLESVLAASSRARAEGLRLLAWCADVTRSPVPADVDLVVVTRYLERALCPALAAALAPGGVVVYETFTTGQVRLGRPPRSPEHLLAPGELPSLFPGLDVLFSEEVEGPREAVARLVARRPID